MNAIIFTNLSEDNISKIHRLVGKLEGLVQHPLLFYNIMFRYFGNSFFLSSRKETGWPVLYGASFSRLYREIFFLRQIGAAKDFREKNIAQQMIRRLTVFARQNGYKKIHTTVETGNIASWKMFEKWALRMYGKGIQRWNTGKSPDQLLRTRDQPNP